MPANSPSRILVYHKIDSRREWGVTRVLPDRFEQQVRSLIAAGKHLTTLNDWFNNQGDESMVAITFDDAYESIYRYAFPILQQYGGKSTLFVISDYIGRENTWDVNYGWRRFRHMSVHQLQAMAEAGHEIASHTRTHRSLPHLPGEQIRDELYTSRQQLESITSKPVRFLAYPFANYNQQVLDLTGELGYTAGCIFMRPNRNVRMNGTLVIQRQGVYLHDTIRDVHAKISPGVGFQWQRLKQNIINWAAGGSVLIKRLGE